MRVLSWSSGRSANTGYGYVSNVDRHINSITAYPVIPTTRVADANSVVEHFTQRYRVAILLERLLKTGQRPTENVADELCLIFRHLGVHISQTLQVIADGVFRAVLIHELRQL